MKKVFLACALLLSAAFFSGGCAFHEAQENLRNAGKLRVGMTKEQVLAIMGEPVQNEVYTAPDLWFYYTNPNWIDGLTTEDECMPLVFKDGKLIGWGNEYYTGSRILRARPEQKK